MPFTSALSKRVLPYMTGFTTLIYKTYTLSQIEYFITTVYNTCILLKCYRVRVWSNKYNILLNNKLWNIISRLVAVHQFTEM